MQKHSTAKGRKGSTSTRRPSVKSRARAIINDAKGYDAETRHALNNALEEDSSDLAEMVKRAEAGEEILDISRPLILPLTIEDIRARNPLRDKEAAELVEQIANCLDAASVPKLFLLVHALTYAEAGEREYFSVAIEDRLLCRLPGVDELRNTVMLRELETLRHGGE